MPEQYRSLWVDPADADEREKGLLASIKMRKDQVKISEEGRLRVTIHIS